MAKNKRSVEEADSGSHITRREFLKGAGLIAGGATLASLALTSACDSSPTQEPPGITDSATGSPASFTNTIIPPANTQQSSTSTAKPTSNTALTTTNTAFTYTPPSSTDIPLLDVEGCTTKVAADRMYSIEHIWVKSLPDNLGVMGITDKLQALAYPADKTPADLSLVSLDTELAPEAYFGSFCGQKLTVDFYSPVSGKVVQKNTSLEKTDINPLRTDPYGWGWLVIIKLGKPEELRSLLTPLEYATLIAKTPDHA